MSSIELTLRGHVKGAVYLSLFGAKPSAYEEHWGNGIPGKQLIHRSGWGRDLLRETRLLPPVPRPPYLPPCWYRVFYGIQLSKHKPIQNTIVSFMNVRMAMMAMRTYLPKCSRDKTLLCIYLPSYLHNNPMRWFLLILFQKLVVKFRETGLRQGPTLPP